MTTEAPAHVWTATGRQREVLDLMAKAPKGSTSLIGYGGAAGGAKTNLLANAAIEVGRTWPGVRLLIGRQNFVDLKTTTLMEFDAACPAGLVTQRYDSSPVFREFFNGSRVYFRNLDDWQSLMSEEYGWIFIDEASEVTERAIMALVTRLRHQACPKWGIIAGFNPFPSWAVEWFMRKRLPDSFEGQNAVKVDFVKARIEDNPYLPANYKDVLLATQDDYMRAILVEGDPDAALDSYMYFNRERLVNSEQFASPPLERRDTRPLPGEMPDGHVLIWELPVNGERYYIGADTADGKAEELDLLPERGGSDRNAAAIYKAGDDTQVAAIYGRQEEHVYARLLNEWGLAYNRATLVVERNRRSVLVALRELNYPNLFYATRAADQHVALRLDVSRTIEYGWMTDTRSRPVLLDSFREALHSRVIKPRDPDFYREAYNFLNGAKPQAAPGQHDDRVFAHALAFQARRFIRERTSDKAGWRYIG